MAPVLDAVMAVFICGMMEALIVLAIDALWRGTA
jgi:hypothetical protein